MKIALCGKMGSGKSYLANKIAKKHGFTILSFAGKVKELAKELFNMKEKDRKLLQVLSQKLKQIDENIWVNFLETQLDNYENIIIDDLRFPNEYEMLKRNGFTIINIKLDENIRIIRLSNKYKNFKQHLSAMNHISETLLDNFVCDREIVSDDSAFEKLEEFILNRD